MALALAGGSASAQDYACGAWAPSGTGVDPISALTVGKQMAVVKQGGPATTLRLTRGSLQRKTFAGDDAILIVHGEFRRRADGSPGFGPRVTVQQLRHDPRDPILVQTTCEANR
ncbi:hypothetical protein E0K89_020375 [Aquicoccus sp. SCR17]|nr:hypothetical protein [Carideicomes alvinocaridis]